MKALKFIPVIFLFGFLMQAQQQAGVNFSVRIMDFQSVSVEKVIEKSGMGISENNIIRVNGSSAYELKVNAYNNWQDKAQNQYVYSNSLVLSGNSKDEIATKFKNANYQNSKVINASRNNLEMYYDPGEVAMGSQVIAYSIVPH